MTNEGHIVAVDSVSPTVFVISEDGDLVHWFDCSDHMREPSDIAINGKSTVALCQLYADFFKIGQFYAYSVKFCQFNANSVTQLSPARIFTE